MKLRRARRMNAYRINSDNLDMRGTLRSYFLFISSKIRVAYMACHRALVRLYIFMEVYNSVFSKWYKLIVVCHQVWYDHLLLRSPAKR